MPLDGITLTIYIHSLYTRVYKEIIKKLIKLLSIRLSKLYSYDQTRITIQTCSVAFAL